MQNTLSRGLWAAVVFCAGCTSYQETSLHQIEAHPDQLIDKKVRARFTGVADTTAIHGRSARERSGNAAVVSADSVVSLWADDIKYPILSGRTFSDAKMYGAVAPAHAVQLDVTATQKVEVQQFSPEKTLLLFCGIALVSYVLYESYQELKEDTLFYPLSRRALAGDDKSRSPAATR